MYKSLERTIMEMGKPKAQLDEIEIRKSDFLAHEAGKMSMDDLMKKYASQDRRRGNALRGAIQGELRLMRDHQKNNKAVFDRMEEVEVQEGGHEDVVSAKNKVKIAMSALQKMQGELNKLGDDADLPSWWMGKVAIAVDKLDGMADYLDTQVEETQVDEGMMKNMAIDLKDMPADEFQRKYNMSKAEAEKKFGKPEEKTLTPAEKKKREEVAQAISRDNPDMPMDKKMAIATATAKKVAEDIQTEPATNELLVRNFIQKLVKEMQ